VPRVTLGSLCGQLDDQLPLELEALPEVEVIVADRPATTIRTPDIVVVPTSLVETEPARYRAEDVVLAVEVLSPGSSRTDKGAKFTEYAEAEIASYWLVDLEPPVSFCAYQLIDGHYELDCETAEPVELLSPAPVTVDPARLVVSRRTPPAE
jgi:Uma2 family endonuclease